jgi:hypothetical protein
MKKCQKCKLDLPINNFGLSKNALDGLNPDCKDCLRNRRIELKERRNFLELNPHMKVKDGYKVCTVCNTEKPFSDYHSRIIKGITKFRAQCKKCRGKDSWERIKKKFPDNYDVLDRVWKLQRRGVNITQKQYVDLIYNSNGLCEICNNPNTSNVKGSLSVDHDHNNGKVRGLLCDKCNRGLGLFGDNINILLKAAEYLTVHKSI